MPYVLIKNGNIVQHIIMQGDLKKNWKREISIVDLTFTSLKYANENAVALNAEVQELNVDKTLKVA